MLHPSDRAAVAAYERHILATEGPYHVAGCYYANPSDADRQRRWAAERMVREAQRATEYRARCERAERDTAATLAPSPSTSTSTTANRASVGTWLVQRERERVEVAITAHAMLTHRDTLDALRADLITGRVDALLLSAARLLSPIDASAVAAIVRDFPGTSVVGLVADVDEPQAIAGTHALGLAGVCCVVDARTPAGWTLLRGAVDPARALDRFAQRAVRTLAQDPTTGATIGTAGWARFLAAAFAPRAATAKDLARALGVLPSTLNSRCFRVGLPSPKRYLATARLVLAARLAEAPGLSIAAIADRLDASSPQAFGRTVRTMLGMTAAQFRAHYDGEGMLQRFRRDLVDPYRDTLGTFDPLSAHPAAPIHHRAESQSRRQLSARATGRAA